MIIQFVEADDSVAFFTSAAVAARGTAGWLAKKRPGWNWRLGVVLGIGGECEYAK